MSTPDVVMKGQIHFRFRNRTHSANATLTAEWHPERDQFDCTLQAIHLGQTKTTLFSITDEVSARQTAGLRHGIKAAISAWGWKKPVVHMELTYLRP